MSFHTVIIVGRLGKDPEMKYTASNQPVTTFNVASDRQFKDRNGQSSKETIWFRVTVWGKQAKVCDKYLSKGKQVLIEGRLKPDEEGHPRIWTRQDGNPSASYEITALTVRFLSNKEAGDQNPQSQFSDDIPF